MQAKPGGPSYQARPKPHCAAAPIPGIANATRGTCNAASIGFNLGPANLSSAPGSICAAPAQGGRNSWAQGTSRQMRFSGARGRLLRAAPKEKKMKRNLTLWLSLLAFAVIPAIAQAPAATGKIKGRVTNPTGAPTTSGNVSLSTDSGKTSKYTFPVDANGDYQGEAAPGTYTVVFRQPDTPPDKMVDSFDGVKVVLGQDVAQDIDMSRKAFIDKLPPDQQKQLEELKKHNSEALKANEVIKNLNADLKVTTQDIKDADGAHATAVSTLGASAAKADI